MVYGESKNIRDIMDIHFSKHVHKLNPRHPSSFW
jgi:hypothetical protein